MTSSLNLRAGAALGLALAFIAPPGAALAHGLDGSAADKSTLGFLPLGIEHMLLGWDHLLFVAGVLLLSGTFNRAAKLISLFVAGHSTTLIIATLAEWRLSPTFVDVVIALSVVFIGIIGLRGRPDDWRPVSGAVLGFGLIHGLGLSTRLQDLGLPDDGVLGRVIAFNVGIEIGQLAAVAVMVGVAAAAARLLHDPRLPRLAFGCFVAAGLVAAAVLSFPGDDADDGATTAAAKRPASSSCEEGETQPPTSFAGGHPAKLFYAPQETVPEEDLTHVIGDGYVIVRYNAALPVKQRDQLRTLTQPETVLTVAAPAGGPVATIRATTAYRTLTCQTFDLKVLQAFRDKWLADVRSGDYR